MSPASASLALNPLYTPVLKTWPSAIDAVPSSVITGASSKTSLTLTWMVKSVVNVPSDALRAPKQRYVDIRVFQYFLIFVLKYRYEHILRLFRSLVANKRDFKIIISTFTVVLCQLVSMT